MTITLEISPETQAQIERAAAESHTDIFTFIVAAAAEKAARVFDETRFGTLLDSDPLSALDYLVEVTPNHRAEAGLPPLTNEQVSRAAYYE